MKRGYRKLAVAISTVMFLMASLQGARASEELESKQERIDAIEEEQERIRSKLSELDGLKDDVSAYIEAVDEELEETVQSLSDLEMQMEAARAGIETARAELEAAKETEQEQYENMKLRIRYMYEKGDTIFLEMLFSSASLSEFLSRTEYISQISEYDRNMLAAYAETKQFITDRTVELENAYASLENMAGQAEAKQLSLSELQAAKEEELSELNEEISENQDLMADYDEALKDELDEFMALEEAIRQREEEEARALAESAEASRQAEETKEPETTAEVEKTEPSEEGTGEETTEEGETKETEKPTKAPTEAPAKPQVTSFIWPVPSCGRISSGYGSRDDPLTGESDGALSDHHGIDVALPGGALAGADIVAAADGEVIIARASTSAGNWIVLYHGNSTYTVYMHCQRLLVSAGDTVKQGKTIGLVGNTGWSTGAHLHFEVRVGGFSTSAYSKNPLNYVSPP